MSNKKEGTTSDDRLQTLIQAGTTAIVKLPKKNFFFDTSILSPITFIDQGQQPEVVIKNWVQFLDQMESVHANFADNDFIWIATPMLFLELVGFGQIKNELKLQASQVVGSEWRNFVSSEAELATGLFCDHIAKRIRTFIRMKLPSNKIYRQGTVNFLRKYKSHPNSYFLAARIKRWAKNIRSPQYYAVFADSFFWDTIFRYPFINLKEIPVRDRPVAMKLWAGVMGRLFRNYYELHKIGFEYSVLGLFAELHRIGDCFNSENPDQKKYDILMRTWDDMADADSISYALLGRGGQPVNIVTMEKKTDIERRLVCLAKNLKDIADLGFKIDFCPGTITIFSQSIELTDFFSVQDIINSI